MAMQAIPFVLAINNTRASVPNIIITNSGAQRFDLYAGPFTKNDQLTATPFIDLFKFIPNVAFSVANEVLPSLNNAGANKRRAFQEVLQERGNKLHDVDRVYRKWLEEMDRRNQIELRVATNLTLGYVTTDVRCKILSPDIISATNKLLFKKIQSCPGVGDDVPHIPLPFFSVPDFVGSIPPTVSDDAPIDLVFAHFISDQLLGVLNSIQTSKRYTQADVQTYTSVQGNEVLGLYAQAAWN